MSEFIVPKTRLELQAWLETTTGKGSDQILFQPPSLEKVKKPCWIYRLLDASQTSADNVTYQTATAYELTFITQNPDSVWISRMMKWPRCRFVRYYSADGFNHYVYRIWTST